MPHQVRHHQGTERHGPSRRDVQRLRRRLQHRILRQECDRGRGGQQGRHVHEGQDPHGHQRAPHDGRRRRQGLPVDARPLREVRGGGQARPGHLDLQPRAPVGHAERRLARAVPGRRGRLDALGRQGLRGHPLRCATLHGASPSRQAHACFSPRVRCPCTGEDLRATSNQDFIAASTVNNSLCFLGPHRVFSAWSATYQELVPGQGHFVRNCLEFATRATASPSPNDSPPTLRFFTGSRRASGGAHATRLRFAQFALLAHATPFP